MLQKKSMQLRDRAERLEQTLRPAHLERSGEIRLASRGTHARVLIGVVRNLPFSGYTGVRKAPACEGRIATGRVSVREAARLPVVKPAGAEAVPGPAG